MSGDGGLSKRLAALGGAPRKSLRRIVMEDINSIRAARARNVAWEDIARAIEEEHGITINVDTLKVYASEFWSARPVKNSRQPSSPAAFSGAAPATDKPASTAAPNRNSGRPSDERHIRRPNIDPDEYE